VEEELREIYCAHCPEKSGNIAALLEKFSGREQELLEKVRRKYGLSEG
jgi:hypothetical protein